MEVMFNLFALHWFVAAGLNFLSASDPFFESPTSCTVRDFGIGALLGVNIVILIEYARGFFIDAQQENDFIRMLAFTLNLMGLMMYGAVSFIVVQIMLELRR